MKDLTARAGRTYTASCEPCRTQGVDETLANCRENTTVVAAAAADQQQAVACSMQLLLSWRWLSASCLETCAAGVACSLGAGSVCAQRTTSRVQKVLVFEDFPNLGRRCLGVQLVLSTR